MGERVHSWRWRRLGLGKGLALFGAHFLYFFTTLDVMTQNTYLAKLVGISHGSDRLTRWNVNAI